MRISEYIANILAINIRENWLHLRAFAWKMPSIASCYRLWRKDQGHWLTSWRGLDSGPWHLQGRWQKHLTGKVKWRKTPVGWGGQNDHHTICQESIPCWATTDSTEMHLSLGGCVLWHICRLCCLQCVDILGFLCIISASCGWTGGDFLAHLGGLSAQPERNSSWMAERKRRGGGCRI